MLTIARFTFIEAVKNRLFILVIIGVTGLFALAFFTGELAITETRQVQVVILASSLRIFAVSIVSLFVITSIVREFTDKGSELILSLPLPRYKYYFGKFFGYTYLAVLIAILVSLPMLFFAGPGSTSLWLVSLCCEMLLIIALSLLSLFTFTNITFAFIVVMSFYLLSRSIESIQLLSASPILEFRTMSQEFMNQLVDVLALLLPNLGHFTNSSWLVYAAPAQEFIIVLVQTAVYLPILVAAGLFDLYRKNL